MDTWDPKPEAPVEHRSPFKPIDTNVPGIQFTELLAKTARHADKLAVVRSMTHTISGHPEGTAYLLQGAKPRGTDWIVPDIGTTIGLSPHRHRLAALHSLAYAMVPGNGEQSYNTKHGFLSAGLKVFRTGGRDLSDPKWRVNDLRILEGVDPQRFRDRHSLLSNLDVGLVPTGLSRSAATMGNFFERAFNMLDNPQHAGRCVRPHAPDGIGRTPGALRPGTPGPMLSLGTAFNRGRDPVRHLGRARAPGNQPHAGRLQHELGPSRLDLHQRFVRDHSRQGGRGGAVRDRHLGDDGKHGSGVCRVAGRHARSGRGLLDETLVCFVTEFGRTPRLNKFQGRDHWPHAYSIAFAGAGVRPGQIIGKTDRDGGFVLDQAFTPDDVCCHVCMTRSESMSRTPVSRLHAVRVAPCFWASEGRADFAATLLRTREASVSNGFRRLHF